MTAMWDIVPHMEYDSMPSAWLMFEKKRASVPRPWQLGTLMLMDLQMYGSELEQQRLRESPQGWMYDTMCRPLLVMTETHGDTYSMGSGWLFTEGMIDRDAAMVQMDDGGGFDTLKQLRFMTFERNGLANTLLCVPVNDQTLFCTLTVELDGRTNGVHHFVVERATRQAVCVATYQDRRSCDLCALQEERCRCESSIDLELQDAAFAERTRKTQMVIGTTHLFGSEYSKSWLQGRWAFNLEQFGMAGVDIFCHTKGPVFDKSLLMVLQAEVTRLFPPQSSERIVATAKRALRVNTENSAGRYKDVATSSRSGGSKSNTSPRSGTSDAKVKSRCCPMCPKSFYQTGHLTEHMRSVHGGLGAHECGICRKRFGVKSKLERHIQTVHEKERRFVCYICKKGYKEKSYLKQHLATLHRKDMNEVM
mmetsp:Transcript_7485/g.22722  ORF Transcript_7485/g.22722 Transcript_7485/m.22722 type:complete len:421 (-) Transcript_7485:1507-2769(-)